ncbi:hypothetical protein CHS0354_035433 [Potamilus streckersoni]|uniref:Uncharacterized protein n=1 Tax=Potamilus streckersoni TaxID=2493646 RepID=A0AAE0WCF2_9BIVA|nr:hypothetical protein CHS0354_035433 [Potamilus streckersoni]
MIYRRTASNLSTNKQIERSDHYVCKISKTNVEIRASKKNPQNNTIEKGLIERGVVTAYFEGGYAQQKQLSSPYLPCITDKPQIIPEHYQNIKKAMTKSFPYVFEIPTSEKEAVTEIMYHLDKAIEFGNEWAAVEKGIVLRQIKEHKRAFELFLWTLNMKRLGTTMVTVSCYEHLGVCCRDIAKYDVNPEEKKTLEADAIKYFRKAIETIAYKTSKELDFLKDVSMAYPTLKHMFESQEGCIETLKKLVEVSKMLEKYGETLEFYEQIKAMDEEQPKDPAIIHGEIEILLAKREFDQAAVLLDLQNCTKLKDEINKEFCMLVYLECAFHLVNDKMYVNAHRRFRQAFDIYCTEINREKEKTEFDIFFLYEEDIETNEAQSPSLAFTLAKKLENFVPGESGLRMTCNSDNVKPGRKLRKEQT